jgi:hypothetical protein
VSLTQVLKYILIRFIHFCFSYFSDKVSCFFTGLASDSGLPTYVSVVAGITGKHHHASPVFEMVSD